MSIPAFPGRLTPGDPVLDARQRAIFGALLHCFTRDAQPVASERIAREPEVGGSAAAVRQVLAELESAGLVQRSHAASGRWPSARGWEYHVRVLLEPASLPEEWEARIDERLGRSARDAGQLLGEASRLLASLTDQLGIAVASSLESARIASLELDLIDSQRVCLTLQLDGPGARTLLLEAESPLDPGALTRLERALREELTGETLGEARRRLASGSLRVRAAQVRAVGGTALHESLPSAMWAAGTARMGRQPEFADARRLDPVLKAVEGPSPLDRIMASGVQGHATVRVGVDEALGLSGCSLVSVALPFAGSGAVGVLGPLRMNYALALAVVDRVGARVAELLSA